MRDSPSDDRLKRIIETSSIGVEVAREFVTNPPDVIVLYGDRAEVIYVAVAAVMFGIPIVHLQGGDRTGSVDEIFRHAITKMSSLHYVSCQDSADRVIRMGEDQSRTLVVGDSHVDTVVHSPWLTKASLSALLDKNLRNDYCVLLQHPETTRLEDTAADIDATICALRKTGINTVAIYPCSDPGADVIIDALERENRARPFLGLYKNLEFDSFINLCRHALFIIGNSSSGIIESSYIGLPAINIGRRQNLRPDGGNVLHVGPSIHEIAAAIRKLQKKDFRRKIIKNAKHLYGDGNSYLRIYDDLKSRNISELLPKYITY